MYTDYILQGVLPFPKEEQIKEAYPDSWDSIQRMWNSLWGNFLRNPNTFTSVPFWSDQFPNEQDFRDIIEALVLGGWLYTSINPNHHWGEMRLVHDKFLSYVTPDQLTEVRRRYKYSKYKLGFNESRITDLTRQNGCTRYTGLVREGFAKAGNTQFGYDTAYINKYLDPINRNMTKSMEKIRNFYPELQSDQASYDKIAVGVVDLYRSSPSELYTCGNNFNDSRGRAISTCLQKLGNPISSKDFRALLVVTY